MLTVLLAMHQPIPFDAPLMAAAKPYAGDGYLWNVVSESANFPLVAIGLGIVAMLFLAHRRRDAILVLFVLAAATAGSEGVKQLVHRPRPPGGDTVVPGVVYSYPSGHTLEALTIFGILTIITWRSDVDRRIKVALLVFTILFVAAVAVARVSINAHYPSDVLGGVPRRARRPGAVRAALATEGVAGQADARSGVDPGSSGCLRIRQRTAPVRLLRWRRPLREQGDRRARPDRQLPARGDDRSRVSRGL